jgi:hypothetical protein
MISAEEKIAKIEEYMKEVTDGKINDNYFRLKVYALLRTQ